ncbi:hypothetical protein CKO_00387 [Citrobacter koseri ATCC BAA-895]|uniref:Uncharacterized protein n=1 Tax=Citrobacter koseri (strain ATCC BAA-895 / CDC 4225-83 / SGSC4696) TaxID=290338 RepID=A8ADI8_CITK8|nr:hypothetical protein CKO_00387 [Citrobacter koseri ATCC BAA-895]
MIVVITISSCLKTLISAEVNRPSAVPAISGGQIRQSLTILFYVSIYILYRSSGKTVLVIGWLLSL